MRVMLVVYDFSPGGSERIALRLGSRLAEKGVEVFVFCGRNTGPLSQFTGSGVECVVPKRELKRSRFSWLPFVRALVCSIRHHRPDILFLPGNSYLSLAGPLVTIPVFSRPKVVLKLSNVLAHPGRSRVRQAVFDRSVALRARSIDHCVFMSQSLLEADAARIALPRERLHVVDQPVLDVLPARSAGCIEGENEPVPLIVAAGRFVRQKNFGLLLEAAALLAERRRFELCLIGDGPLREELAARTRRLGIDGHVRFAGYVDDVGAFMVQARLFVLSSDFEGFPSVIVEAMAHGLPVVATDCSPAIRDLVDDSSGRIVKRGDPTAMARAMETLLESARPTRQVLAGRVERYDIEESAEQYLRLFREILGAEALSP